MPRSDPDTPTPSVALLGRAVPARQRLREALVRIGARVVLEDDPATLDAQRLRAAAPEVVLVALEPAIEEAMEALQSVLDAPNLSVIFDDAELAARREGWEAQRWLRHLAAKLYGHEDVLPPRAPADPALTVPATLLSASLPPAPAALTVSSATALASSPGQPFAEPIDETIAPSISEPIEAISAGLIADGDVESGHASGVEAIRGLAEPSMDVSIDEMNDWLASLSGTQSAVSDAGRSSAAAMSSAAFAFDRRGSDEVQVDLVSDEPPSGPLALDLPPDLPFDLPRAAPSADVPSPVDVPDLASLLSSPRPSPPVSTPMAMPLSPTAILAEISASDWTPPAPPTPDWSTPRRQDVALTPTELALAELEPELDDAASASEVVGAIVVFAGVGGPDALRRLLAALPPRFPRAVLVRMTLDGGQYINLVRQMARVSALPVELGEAGRALQAGRVYVVGDGLTLIGQHGVLAFAASGRAAALLPTLPPADSGALLLSGSDVALLDDALALASAGGWVAGQSGQGCYDPSAALRLVEHGLLTAAPDQLARALAERWPD